MASYYRWMNVCSTRPYLWAPVGSLLLSHNLVSVIGKRDDKADVTIKTTTTTSHSTRAFNPSQAAEAFSFRHSVVVDKTIHRWFALNNSSKTLCEQTLPQQEATPSTLTSGNTTNDTTKSNLPFYTTEQVAQRNGQDGKETWVTYAHKVYNITNFIREHKGGSLIRTAAGGHIEDYWAYWGEHLLVAEPLEILQQHHIGYLVVDNDDDEEESLQDKLQSNYANDPVRDARQKAYSTRPWCSETPPDLQTTLYTPNAVFYTRNHAPVPEFTTSDVDEYSITWECCGPMCGRNTTTTKTNMPDETTTAQTTTLADLSKEYSVQQVVSVLECAGNRAAALERIHPTDFSNKPARVIESGMMSNAVWSGYSLRDVLLDRFPWLGQLNDDELEQYHVEFHGVDDYKTSTPLRRVLDPTSHALLCTGMNGQDLPPDHGYPVRVFLPGIAGARSVKWVHTIRILPHESDSCFTNVYYLDPYGKASKNCPCNPS